ncbi:hypothetical protein [Microseira wollei]|nr:hypothetical protein [Microseira wollei]
MPLLYKNGARHQLDFDLSNTLFDAVPLLYKNGARHQLDFDL